MMKLLAVVKENKGKVIKGTVAGLVTIATVVVGAALVLVAKGKDTDEDYVELDVPNNEEEDSE